MTTRQPLYKSLYLQVIVAIIIGILLGHYYPETAVTLKPLGDGFVKLIKMVIAPIIFCTVVSGIAGMQSMKSVGDTLLVNPGETCGWMFGVPGAALLDLDTKKVEFLNLDAKQWKY